MKNHAPTFQAISIRVGRIADRDEEPDDEPKSQSDQLARVPPQG